jgi:hypothetical protein
MFSKKVLVLICFLGCTQLFAQNKIPSIHEVAQKFYNTYSVQELSYPAVDFEKRKLGWTVTTKKIVNNNLVNDKSYSFYNVNDAVYFQLPLPAKEDDNVVDYKLYIDDYKINGYQLHLFYGYTGWYKDVINELSSKSNLSDSALYSLARAYSTYASSLLGNQSGDAIEEEIFNLPLNNNCLINEQLSLYNSIEQKSIQTFKQLKNQNEQFVTTVGPIAVKYANETIVQFHALLTYANKAAVSFELPNNLYSDSVIQETKKILAACPTNAILFSFGDNDFYPVLYVQHKLGFRKDVHLINESLLGLDRYIFAATQPQFNSKGIQISVDTNFYKGNKNDYLSMELNDSTIPFSKVIQLIKNTKNNGAEPLKIPANYFKIKYKEHGLEVQFNVPFLLKNNWVLLDILNNLNGRKFCIPNSFYDSFKGLNKYFTEVENTGLRVL